MPSSAKELFVKEIESVRDSYLKDLEAMSPEQLGKSPGGSARTPYDFTFEAVFVNDRIATRLRGETPSPVANDDTWITAPADFCDKQKAINGFRDSMNKIIDAFTKADESKLLDPIMMANGSETCLLKLAYFACMHNSYHDAQLNYLQALSGDDKVHW